jgi:hypothetical protein
MEITFYIAIYGALLSTMVFLWNIYVHLTDKGKLIVYCYFGYEIGFDYQSELHLAFSITNKGKKDIMVTGIAGKFEKGYKVKHFLITAGLPYTKLPKMLKPGEYLVEQIRNYRDIFQHKIDYLYVCDSLNKKYKVNKKDIEKIEKEFHENKSKT